MTSGISIVQLKLKYLLMVAVICSLYSCEKIIEISSVFTNQALADELKTSPEILLIDGHSYDLSAFLWRDFMPVAEPNGSPLLGVSYFTDADSLLLPTDLELIRQYVVYESDIWMSDFDEIRQFTDYTLEGVVRDGPKWGPDVVVDVICEIKMGGITYFIQERDQKITATY